jgi:hypothetical protein
MIRLRWCIVLFSVLLVLGTGTTVRAQPACTEIHTAADLELMRTSISGTFCLANDIDIASAPGFVRIPVFDGSLDGRGHVISNFKTSIFDVLAGSVRNLGLANVDISTVVPVLPFSVGPLAYSAENNDSGAPSVIENVWTSGSVSGAGPDNSSALVGGLVGATVGYEFRNVRADVKVTSSGSAGGLISFVDSSIVQDAYATGAVYGDLQRGTAGGLTGITLRSIYERVFAVGPVTGQSAGGLIGSATENTRISKAYALGNVEANLGLAGGLIGGVAPQVELSEVYAAGSVIGPQFLVGGLLARQDGPAVEAFWDIDTTGQTISARGTPMTTEQLRGAVPFSGTDWAITPDRTYPYLTGFDFIPPLATIVSADRLYIALPTGQLDPWEYASRPKHADAASKAAAFAMVARAIGVARGDTDLSEASISDFWRDASQEPRWSGPVKTFAKLGEAIDLGRDDVIDGTNVIGQLRRNRFVLLRGTYKDRDRIDREHWVLATSIIKDEAGTITAVVANDPWTGTQIEISPMTRTVSRPADFALRKFKVKGFQAAILK